MRGELDAYGAGLEDKPEVIALSRADLMDDKDLEKLRKKLVKASGGTVFVVSAATGDGVEPLIDALFDLIGEVAEVEAEEAEPVGDWSPL